jgi:hypothetical protein
MIRALVAAVPFETAEEAVAKLARAEMLAAETSEEDVAFVLAAKARRVAIYDRHEARGLNERAIEICRRWGSKSGVADCLFSMSIGEGSDRAVV